MADNGLSKDGLSKDGLSLSSDEEKRAAERRAFLKRAAIIGLPVALSTVHARTAWAQAMTRSCAMSRDGASACFNR